MVEYLCGRQKMDGLTDGKTCKQQQTEFQFDSSGTKT